MALLPGTGEELRAIGALFGRQKQEEMSYLRLEASEEHAKSPELAGYGYIHFAAHGILRRLRCRNCRRRARTGS